VDTYHNETNIWGTHGGGGKPFNFLPRFTRCVLQENNLSAEVISKKATRRIAQHAIVILAAIHQGAAAIAAVFKCVEELAHEVAGYNNKFTARQKKDFERSK